MGSFLFDADNNLKVNVVVGASSGGLTDAQLRATPVPVSGDFTSDGLTDTELRASTVPVDFGITTIALLEDIRNELRMMREMLTHVVCETGEAYPKDFIDNITVIE